MRHRFGKDLEKACLPIGDDGYGCHETRIAAAQENQYDEHVSQQRARNFKCLTKAAVMILIIMVIIAVSSLLSKFGGKDDETMIPYNPRIEKGNIEQNGLWDYAMQVVTFRSKEIDGSLDRIKHSTKQTPAQKQHISFNQLLRSPIELAGEDVQISEERINESFQDINKLIEELRHNGFGQDYIAELSVASQDLRIDFFKYRQILIDQTTNSRKLANNWNKALTRANELLEDLILNPENHEVRVPRWNDLFNYLVEYLTEAEQQSRKTREQHVQLTEKYFRHYYKLKQALTIAHMYNEKYGKVYKVECAKNREIMYKMDEYRKEIMDHKRFIEYSLDETKKWQRKIRMFEGRGGTKFIKVLMNGWKKCQKEARNFRFISMNRQLEFEKIIMKYF